MENQAFSPTSRFVIKVAWTTGVFESCGRQGNRCGVRTSHWTHVNDVSCDELDALAVEQTVLDHAMIHFAGPDMDLRRYHVNSYLP